MKEIILRGKIYRVSFVDDEDYNMISQYPWYFVPNNRTGYAARFKPTVYMHRMILDVSDLEIDHINNNGLDNRKSNLRICTSSQNKRNRKFKGYFYNNDRLKWQVRVRNIHGGFYDNEQDAIIAATNLKIKLYGEFANIDIPEISPYKWDKSIGSVTQLVE